MDYCPRYVCIGDNLRVNEIYTCAGDGCLHPAVATLDLDVEYRSGYLYRTHLQG